MDEILKKYEIRKSNKEKTAFIEYIKQRLESAGYDAEQDVKIDTKGKGILKSRNIVVGDPETSKVVLGAHYDTCSVLPFPNFMSPVSVPLFVISQVAITVLIFAFVFIVTFVAVLLTNNNINAGLFYFVFLYIFLFYMLIGYRNKHTANDNTSGVITITRILEKLPVEDRDKVCVVYFDNEEKGLLGSDFFKSKYKKVMDNKVLINFDCVGDGKNIVVLAKEKTKSDDIYQLFVEALSQTAFQKDVELKTEKLRTLMFGSDQMHLKKGVGVCALRNSPVGMYVARIHTPFDTKCREENISCLAEGTVDFLKKL